MKQRKLKPGHAEIIGETLAKVEFFEAGWNPYERFLDVDKVDLLLRKNIDQKITYREIQVKYGKLYNCGAKWEKELFDYTSWRFFRENEFHEYSQRDDFFITYVLASDSGYDQDIFIFPITKFIDLLKDAIPSKEQKKVYFSRSKENPTQWFMRRQGKKFAEINSDSCIEITKYRRNFDILN